MRRVTFRYARGTAVGSVRSLAIGVLAMGVAVGACAGGLPTLIKPKAVGTATKPKAKRWYQVGVASWYGGKFNGRTTAAGEIYDMNEMTCAHPSLPMGTWLRVTNLRNQRTTFVRVNDRGPVVDGRIVDLSFAAAQILGMPGIARVKLEPVRADDAEMALALVSQMQMPVLFDPLPR